MITSFDPFVFVLWKLIVALNAKNCMHSIVIMNKWECVHHLLYAKYWWWYNNALSSTVETCQKSLLLLAAAAVNIYCWWIHLKENWNWLMALAHIEFNIFKQNSFFCRKSEEKNQPNWTNYFTFTFSISRPLARSLTRLLVCLYVKPAKHGLQNCVTVFFRCFANNRLLWLSFVELVLNSDLQLFLFYIVFPTR